MRRITFTCTFLLSSVFAFTGIGHSAVPARLYDFEEGTVGGTADSIADKIDVLFNPAPFFDTPTGWLDIPGGADRPLPSGATRDVVESTARSAPPLSQFMGAITFVDVSDGSPLDSPQPGSTVAASFDGATVYDDFDFDSGLGGSRGVYVTFDDFENDASPVVGSESFSLMTQAWVRPDSSAIGTLQTVWQAGNEQGKIVITDDETPVWRVDNIGGGLGDGPGSGIPVVFDEWTHVAIFRGGNGAELYINGTLVEGDRNPDPPNFFGAFASIIALGADEFGSDGFVGAIDDFVLSGFGDASLTTADLQYCDAFPGTAECPVVVVEPSLSCDFDGDGDCDFGDIDALYANFGTGDAAFDVNTDGAVNAADIGDWLTAASSTENTFNTDGVTYVLGDVNLDGNVDSTDLGLLLNNFGNGDGLGFGSGNQNDDANVDSTDLGLLLNNFGTAASAAAVPEPAMQGWMMLVMAALVAAYRRR